MYWATIVFYKLGTDVIDKVQVFDDTTGQYMNFSTRELINYKFRSGIDIVNLIINNNRVELFCTPKNRIFQSLIMKGYDIRSYAYLAEMVRDKYRLIIGDLSNFTTVDAYYTMLELLEMFDIDKHKLMLANAMVIGNRKQGYAVDFLDNFMNDKIKAADKNDIINRAIRKSSSDHKSDIAYRKQDGKLIIEDIYHKGIGIFTIPEGVNHIEKYSGGINHIILPKTLDSNGLSEDFASNMADLYDITIPDGCGLRIIPNGCFQSSGIKRIHGLNNITQIRHYAFDGSDLTGNIVSENLKAIGESAFGDTYIKSFIAHNLEYMGKHAFNNCCKLEMVNLGNKITKIPTGAFEGCSALKYIEIPGSVDKIGQYAFTGCLRLREVRISKNTKICPDSFSRYTRVITV